MANAIWQATIVDQSGNVLPGAEVEVVDESTGLSAPLFTTRTGTTKSNPFFADANGFAQFYAAQGLYRITATSSGTGTTMTWRNVRLIDVATNAEAIAGTAGVVPDAAGVHASFNQFGLGDVIPYMTDPDDRLANDGSYLGLSSLTADKPYDSYDYFVTHLRSGSGGSVTQQALNIAMVNGGPRIKQRGWNNSTSQWTPWVEMYHTGNSVGTVSQSGGVPTGSIIERGSNANGEYVRYADGTLYCWGHRIFTLPSAVAAGDYFLPLGTSTNKLSNSLPTSFVSGVTFISSISGDTTTDGSSLNGNRVFVWWEAEQNNLYSTNKARSSGLSPAISGYRLESEGNLGSLIINSTIVSWSFVGRWF